MLLIPIYYSHILYPTAFDIILLLLGILLGTCTFGIADVSFNCNRAKTPSICICICSQWMRLLRSPRHCGFVSQGHVGVRVGEPHRPAKPIITIMAIIIVMITVGVIKSGSKCDNYGQRSRASCKQKL